MVPHHETLVASWFILAGFELLAGDRVSMPVTMHWPNSDSDYKTLQALLVESHIDAWPDKDHLDDGNRWRRPSAIKAAYPA